MTETTTTDTLSPTALFDHYNFCMTEFRAHELWAMRSRVNNNEADAEAETDKAAQWFEQALTAADRLRLILGTIEPKADK